MTANKIPLLFHPPLSPFIIGQIGLFAQKAIFATLEAINPNPNTNAYRLNRAGFVMAA